MNVRRFVKCIALSVVFLIGGQTPSVDAAAPATVTDFPPYLLTAELDRKLGVRSDVERPDEYVRVLYFHRTPGCATCQKMAKYVESIVAKNFAKEVAQKRIVLRYYDFEAAENEKLVRRFQIGSPTLIVVQGRDGKDVRAKKATKIWPLSGDRDAFERYVDKEIRDYLTIPATSATEGTPQK